MRNLLPRSLAVPLLGALLAAGTTAGPAAASDPGIIAGIVESAALPACRYASKKTRYRSPKQWKKTLVDTERKVGRRYVPGGLVPVSRAGVSGGGVIRRAVIADLRAMARKARSKGKPFKVRSAYRSFSYQKAVFDGWVRQLGLEAARKVSARPGHSEHQLGTTLDFQSAGTSRAPWDYGDWAKTKAGRWLKDNAWKYGFIMSYPKGKANEVCYSYEPWHYRYVGRDIARTVHDGRKTLRRYLWQRFESS